MTAAFNLPKKNIDLFKTRVWFFDLSLLSQHFHGWNILLQEMRKKTPASFGRSNQGGWNTDKIIFDEPSFNPLRDIAAQAFQAAFLEMLLNKLISFKLQAWANIHESHAYNSFHHHPNVLLSGVFYLSAPQGSGALVLRDPRPGVNLSGFEGCGANCSQDIRILPQVGMLVIFPHWLEHSVEANDATQQRISIGMNAVFSPVNPPH